MAEGGKSCTFTFDHFQLHCDRLMLYRDGLEVTIPPKAAKTLAVLVESAGKVIPKEELIEKVWEDSIVEESNLSQYLYLLRKTLGTMPDGRPYIETLRRRGYRFNGHVERITEAEPAAPAAEPAFEPITSSMGPVEREGNVLRLVDWKPSQAPERVDPGYKEATSAQPERDPSSQGAAGPLMKRTAILRLALAGAGVILLFVAGVVLVPRFMPAASSAEPKKELSVVRLTSGHIPAGATIAPDGNVFVYNESDGETSLMYVQQTGQSSRIQIAYSTDKVFIAQAFSPDAQSIYYNAIDKKTTVPALYAIPTMGGASAKIADNVHSAATFSPDGNQIAFSRRNRSTGENSIIIAAKDGRAERVLLNCPPPHRGIGSSLSWSPDGKTIAFSELAIESGRAYEISRLYLVDVATGRVVPVSAEKWDNILRIMWMPDGSGIAAVATRENDGYSTRRDQVYFVAYPSGVSQRLTTDGNRHEPESLGVTKRGEILAVASNRSGQVWVMNANGDAASAVQLTRGAADGRAGLGPLADGRFSYLARNADHINVMIGAVGQTEEPKQLATGFGFVEELRADPLGRFLVFSTQKDGKSHIFRLDIESGSVRQLTAGEREIDSTISPDGRFLVHDSGRVENGRETFSLLRMPTEGGEPVTLKHKGCILPTFSPDGSMLSCVDPDLHEIVIVSATEGAELERHPLPALATWNFGIGWTPDGSGLMYIVTEKGTSNLWIQPRDGGKPRAFTNFTSGIIYRYAFAPDGSKLYISRGYPTQDAILIKNFR